MDLNELSTKVGNAASKVHKELGPFLSPTIYRACMMMELRSMDVSKKTAGVADQFRGILAKANKQYLM